MVLDNNTDQREVALWSPSSVVCLFPLITTCFQGPDLVTIEDAKLSVTSVHATALRCQQPQIENHKLLKHQD